MMPVMHPPRPLLIAVLATTLGTSLGISLGNVVAEPPTTQPSSPQAADATPAPTLDELRSALRARLRAELAELPRHPYVPLTEIVQIRAEPDGLSVVTALRETNGDVLLDGPPSGDPQPPDAPAGAAVAEAAELQPLVRLAVIGKPTGELATPVFFRLTVHLFNEPEAVYGQLGLFANRDIGQFQLTYDTEGPFGHFSVQLIQSPRIAGQLTSAPDEMLALLVRRIDNDSGEATLSFRGTAADLQSLRRRYPTETNLYLRPVFEKLGQLSPLFTADQRVAWQVLGVLPELTDGERAELDRILTGLEADRFADRQRAQAALRALGQRGALAVRTLDRSRLTPNQNAELDAFLAAYSPLTDAEVQRLAASPEFLLDCLELDVPELRAAAWQRLRPLHAWPAGLDFDPDAPAEQRTRQVAALRQHLIDASR